MKKLLIYIFPLFLLLTQSLIASDEPLDQIKGWFQGEFSTSEQASNDSHIIDLNLRVYHFEIKDMPGLWALLITSFTKNQENPYKVEVYHFNPPKLGFINLDKYSLLEPERYKKDLMNDSLLNNITIGTLELKNHCSLLLKSTEKGFYGASSGKNCISTIRNSKYSTTVMEITKVDFFLWEQGFDAFGKLVWGSDENGYVFKKIK